MSRKVFASATLGIIIACACLRAAENDIIIRLSPGDVVQRSWPDQVADDPNVLRFIGFSKGSYEFRPGSAELRDDGLENFRELVDNEDLAYYRRPALKTAPKAYAPVFSGEFMSRRRSHGGGHGGAQKPPPPPTWVVNARVEMPSIQIVSWKTDLELIQADDDKRGTTVVAKITPPERTIVWEITGPGADFVDKPQPGPQSNGESSLTVTLRKPSHPRWSRDTSITVTAYDAKLPSIRDSVRVSLTKFKRGYGESAPGIQPVLTRASLNTAGSASVLRYELESESRGLVGSLGGDLCSALLLFQMDIVQNHFGERGDLSVRYQSDSDRGWARMCSVDENVRYDGEVEVDATSGPRILGSSPESVGRFGDL